MERAMRNYAPTAMAMRTLSLEFKGLQDEPVEGFVVKLADEECLFEWEVAIFGPPDTLYEGGYFKAKMRFPSDYPYSPPSLRFLTKVWHPNVYENGDLCISILHPPIDDPQSGEMACERWNPTQTVRTVLLSVISLLNEPNIASPANVDASVMYRRWKDSKGNDKEYENVIKKQVEQSSREAEREGVRIPSTIEEYCGNNVKHTKEVESSNDYYITDFDEFDDDTDGEENEDKKNNDSKDNNDMDVEHNNIESAKVTNV